MFWISYGKGISVASYSSEGLWPLNCLRAFSSTSLWGFSQQFQVLRLSILQRKILRLAGSPHCQTHVYFSREQVILTNEQILWEKKRNFLRSSSGLTEHAWCSCIKYMASGNTNPLNRGCSHFLKAHLYLSSKGSIKLCTTLKNCSTSKWPFHVKHHRPLPTGMDSFFPLLFLQEVIMCLWLQQFLKKGIFFLSLFSSTLAKVLNPGLGFMLKTRQNELLRKGTSELPQNRCPRWPFKNNYSLVGLQSQAAIFFCIHGVKLALVKTIKKYHHLMLSSEITPRNWNEIPLSTGKKNLLQDDYASKRNLLFYNLLWTTKCRIV